MSFFKSIYVDPSTDNPDIEPIMQDWLGGILAFQTSSDAPFTYDGKASMVWLLLVRDCVGDVLMSAGENYRGTPNALFAEAEAVRFGLRYTFDVGFRCIELESDSSSPVKLLTQKD